MSRRIHPPLAREGHHKLNGIKWGDGTDGAESLGADSGLMYPNFHYPRGEPAEACAEVRRAAQPIRESAKTWANDNRLTNLSAAT